MERKGEIPKYTGTLSWLARTLGNHLLISSPNGARYNLIYYSLLSDYITSNPWLGIGVGAGPAGPVYGRTTGPLEQHSNPSHGLHVLLAGPLFEAVLRHCYG